MKIITEPAPNVAALRKSVPPNVAAAIAKALEKLPADRFESAKEFSDALANPSYSNPGGAHASGYSTAEGADAPLAIMIVATGRSTNVGLEGVPVGIAGDQLIFVRPEGALMAATFDVGMLRVTEQEPDDAASRFCPAAGKEARSQSPVRWRRNRAVG